MSIHPAPALGTGVLDGPEQLHSGVVHEDVEGAELLHATLDGGSTRRFVGDVELDRDGTSPVDLDVADEPVKQRTSLRRQHDHSTVPREAAGGRSPSRISDDAPVTSATATRGDDGTDVRGSEGMTSLSRDRSSTRQALGRGGPDGAPLLCGRVGSVTDVSVHNCLGESLRATPHEKKATAPMNHDSEYTLSPFTESDVAELVVLQRCCWVPEAILNDNLNVPALHETAADVLDWTTTWSTLCLRRGGRLLGAVRARSAPDDAWELGRLMVAPDLEGQGLGRWLLARAEGLAPDSVTRFMLFTGENSMRNIRIYQRAGYELCTPPSDASEHIAGTVFLAKSAAGHAAPSA